MLSESQEPRLVRAVEAWHTEKDEIAFISMLWESGGDFYHYQHWEASYSAENAAELFKHATRIPRNFYLAPLPLPEPGLKMRAPAGTADDPGVYFKKIEPFTYEPESKDGPTPADDLLHEAQICERLAQSPHPNVCRYLGYVPTPDQKNLLGLCFERHCINLYQAVNGSDNSEIAFGVKKVIAGVRSALEHLHALGFVHNDVKPANIMLAADSRAVLIDFDSCHPLGESLKGKKVATWDWDHGGETAEPQNDWVGLDKVQSWLEARASECTAPP
ncbi:kinase-like domain-containing protein [Mycena latifolia]|nr:kinase-like domain-containing protein [Mycena latifolia]